jgi:hypothetical protein
VYFAPQLFQTAILPMKSASASELKATLKGTPQARLVELCLRLARAKKENKELLTFLLYEADDLPSYIQSVKEEINGAFAEINTGNLHWVKKSLRRILRLTNKYIRFTGSKAVEAELLLHFCLLIKETRIPVLKSAALSKLYNSQLKKIEAAIKAQHEDLQRDYFIQLDALKQ